MEFRLCDATGNQIDHFFVNQFVHQFNRVLEELKVLNVFMFDLLVLKFNRIIKLVRSDKLLKVDAQEVRILVLQVFDLIFELFKLFQYFLNFSVH